jgi:hypothetical protein
MENQAETDANGQAEQPARKAYTSPELMEHGSIEALTAGKVAPTGDHGSDDGDGGIDV